jgi:hypothetical protein
VGAEAEAAAEATVVEAEAAPAAEAPVAEAIAVEVTAVAAKAAAAPVVAALVAVATVAAATAAGTAAPSAVWIRIAVGRITPCRAAARHGAVSDDRVSAGSPRSHPDMASGWRFRLAERASVARAFRVSPHSRCRGPGMNDAGLFRHARHRAACAGRGFGRRGVAVNRIA